MPDDYIQHLNLNMSAKNQRLEKALEICVRLQAYKKAATPAKTEVGASLAFQDPTLPSRVTKAKTDIIRLSSCLSYHPSSGVCQPSQRYQWGSRPHYRPC